MGTSKNLLKVRPSAKYDILGIKNIYKIKHNNNVANPELIYRMLQAKLPSSDLKFNIVDNYYYLKEGINSMSIQRMGVSKIRQVKEKEQWCEDEKPEIYDLVFTVDPDSYFKKGLDWRKEIDFLFYQGLQKDPRLVQIAKSHFLPVPNKHNVFQPVNNHAMIFTNTGTGKSFFSTLMGREPVIHPTGPGLLGGGKFSERSVGKLSGGGFLWIDEINIEDTDTMKQMLNYLENGASHRAVHGGIECEGTTCVAFCGNPDGNSKFKLAHDFSAILRRIGGSEAPDRVGRRFGLIAYGLDYKPIKGTRVVAFAQQKRLAITRDVVRDVVYKYNKRLETIFYRFIDWMYKDDEEYTICISEKVDRMKEELLRGFANGMSMSVHRIKCGALKHTLLMNLDLVVKKKDLKFLKSPAFISELNNCYEEMKCTNLESLETMTKLELVRTYESFRNECLKQVTLFSSDNTELASLYDVDESTIRRWKSQYKMDRNK
jgi:hypothetical protein